MVVAPFLKRRVERVVFVAWEEGLDGALLCGRVLSEKEPKKAAVVLQRRAQAAGE